MISLHLSIHTYIKHNCLHKCTSRDLFMANHIIRATLMFVLIKQNNQKTTETHQPTYTFGILFNFGFCRQYVVISLLHFPIVKGIFIITEVFFSVLLRTVQYFVVKQLKQKIIFLHNEQSVTLYRHLHSCIYWYIHIPAVYLYNYM